MSAEQARSKLFNEELIMRAIGMAGTDSLSYPEKEFALATGLVEPVAFGNLRVTSKGRKLYAQMEGSAKTHDTTSAQWGQTLGDGIAKTSNPRELGTPTPAAKIIDPRNAPPAPSHIKMLKFMLTPDEFRGLCKGRAIALILDGRFDDAAEYISQITV